MAHVLYSSGYLRIPMNLPFQFTLQVGVIVNRECNFLLENFPLYIVLAGVDFEEIMNPFLKFSIMYVHGFYIFDFLQFFNFSHRVHLPVEALQSLVWSNPVSGQ
jgi:hypothetical protein